MLKCVGQLDRDEFLSIPQIANNPLALRMIAIFDEDGSGAVDFQEFIAGLSAFSSKGNKEEKLRCTFRGRLKLPFPYCVWTNANTQLHLRCTIWIVTVTFQMESYSSF